MCLAAQRKGVVDLKPFNDMTVIDINEVLTVFSPNGRRYEIKNRPCYRLSFCESGMICYYHNGKTIVSDKNHAVLIPKGSSYYLHGYETGYFPVMNFLCDRDDLFDEFITIELKKPDVLVKKFEQLKRIYLQSQYRAKSMSVFYDILSTISETDNNVNYLTKELADYIEKNLSDPFLTVSEIAASVKISETYCRRMFTQNFGVSPKQYLIDMRIKLAKQLLLEDEKLISDIAESCGFGSVYHFSRTFKQATGMSPTEYRRSVNILLKI